ncbi:hypothetical protein HUJ05_001579 [Dendroctonus ponderosae]|nr:hypothetical protein HUJ05_001579 [Dendroctonus ponderosae]
MAGSMSNILLSRLPPLCRYMRCALYPKTGCKARAVQMLNTLELRLSGTHCHGPEGNQDNVSEFLSALRRSVDLHNTLKDVYNEVALSYRQAAMHRCFKSVRPSMRCAVPDIRRKPNMPRYIVDGFVFHVNITKGKPPMIYLRCMEYKKLGCHARAVIPYDGSLQDIKLNKPHNHEPDFSAEEKIIFMRELKEMTVRNFIVPTRTVHETLAELAPSIQTLHKLVLNSAFLAYTYEFILSANKKPDSLVHMNQIYKFLRREGREKVWNCFKSECAASCYTLNGKVTMRLGLHNHTAPTALIKQRRKEQRQSRNLTQAPFVVVVYFRKAPRPCLVMDNFEFYIESKTPAKTRWCCRLKKKLHCKARLHSVERSIHVTNHEHNHPASFTEDLHNLYHHYVTLTYKNRKADRK